MTNWTIDEATRVTAAQEVQIAARRQDGTLRRPTIIWTVRDGDRIFIRSTNGRGADWFRAAVDAGYRAKYGHYASIVDHLEADGPRSATLQVTPG